MLWQFFTSIDNISTPPPPNHLQLVLRCYIISFNSIYVYDLFPFFYQTFQKVFFFLLGIVMCFNIFNFCFQTPWISTAIWKSQLPEPMGQSSICDPSWWWSALPTDIWCSLLTKTSTPKYVNSVSKYSFDDLHLFKFFKIILLFNYEFLINIVCERKTGCNYWECFLISHV